MSADNYFLIRRANGRFGVSMESASDDDGHVSAVGHLTTPCPIDHPSLVWFDSHDEAIAYGDSQYSEYGIYDESEVDSSRDTFRARLQRFLTNDAHRVSMRGWTRTPDGLCFKMPTGVTVTVAGGTDEDRFEFVDWLMLTDPDGLLELLSPPSL